MEAPRYFVHIPKAGGTTVIGILDRFYPVHKICPWQLWWEVPDEPDFRPYELIRGHFGGGGLSPWLPDASLLTMLRDPQALAISTYGHIRRESGTRYHQQAVDLDMGEFLERSDTQKALNNRQTAFLSFHPVADPAQDQSLFAPQSARRVRALLNCENKPLSESQRLQRAVALIERCQWFGLLERLDESMSLLARTFRAPPIGATHRARNQAQDHAANSSVVARHGEAMRRVTRLDQALYDFAQVQFENRLAASKRHFSLPLATPAPGKVASLGPGERFRYEFAMPLMGSGWHVRERKLPEGDYFRWTGPETTSCLYLPCRSRGAAQLRMRIVNGVDDEVMTHMRWRLNGLDLAPADLEGDGPVREYVADIPDSAWSNSSAKLEIILPHTHRLSEVMANTNDRREVGVAVHWVEVVNLGGTQEVRS